MSYVGYTLGCKECGHRWKVIHEKGRPLPRCPGCAGKPRQEPSAPSLGLNKAADTGIAIPQTQAGREQLAGDLYLQHTGLGDLNRSQREGDIAVRPIATPGLPPNMQANYQGGATGQIGEVIKSLGAGTPDKFKRRNLSLIGRK